MKENKGRKAGKECEKTAEPESIDAEAGADKIAARKNGDSEIFAAEKSGKERGKPESGRRAKGKSHPIDYLIMCGAVWMIVSLFFPYASIGSEENNKIYLLKGGSGIILACYAAAVIALLVLGMGRLSKVIGAAGGLTAIYVIVFTTRNFSSAMGFTGEGLVFESGYISLICSTVVLLLGVTVGGIIDVRKIK